MFIEVVSELVPTADHTRSQPDISGRDSLGKEPHTHKKAALYPSKMPTGESAPIFATPLKGMAPLLEHRYHVKAVRKIRAHTSAWIRNTLWGPSTDTKRDRYPGMAFLVFCLDTRAERTVLRFDQVVAFCKQLRTAFNLGPSPTRFRLGSERR